MWNTSVLDVGFYNPHRDTFTASHISFLFGHHERCVCRFFVKASFVIFCINTVTIIQSNIIHREDFPMTVLYEEEEGGRGMGRETKGGDWGKKERRREEERRGERRREEERRGRDQRGGTREQNRKEERGRETKEKERPEERRREGETREVKRTEERVRPERGRPEMLLTSSTPHSWRWRGDTSWHIPPWTGNGPWWRAVPASACRGRKTQITAGTRTAGFHGL